MEEKKSGYKGFTQARARANAKYMAQFVEAKVRMTEEHREIVRTHAEQRGESLNAFINRAINETMERDKTQGD